MHFAPNPAVEIKKPINCVNGFLELGLNFILFLEIERTPSHYEVLIENLGTLPKNFDYES